MASTLPVLIARLSLDCCAAPGQDRLVDLNRETLSASDIAGALDWWREAGVDLDLGDEPRSWIIAPEAVEAEIAPVAAPPQAPPEPLPAERIGGEAGTLPQTLDDFLAWWMSEPSLDGGMVHARVPPRGPVNAEVMVLVPYPEAEDGERLLSGPRGKLLDAMLAAMGIAPDRAYLASVLTRHTPHPDWAALYRAGLSEVLARHVALAAPQLLIVFDSNILPLLGHDPANSAQTLLHFNHEGWSVPLLPAMELGVILGNPRRKASFWQRWLDWTG
jgi:uracil-DNA glycosylase